MKYVFYPLWFALALAGLIAIVMFFFPPEVTYLCSGLFLMSSMSQSRWGEASEWYLSGRASLATGTISIFTLQSLEIAVTASLVTVLWGADIVVSEMERKRVNLSQRPHRPRMAMFWTLLACGSLLFLPVAWHTGQMLVLQTALVSAALGTGLALLSASYRWQPKLSNGSALRRRKTARR